MKGLLLTIIGAVGVGYFTGYLDIDGGGIHLHEWPNIMNNDAQKGLFEAIDRMEKELGVPVAQEIHSVWDGSDAAIIRDNFAALDADAQRMIHEIDTFRAQVEAWHPPAGATPDDINKFNEVKASVLNNIDKDERALMERDEFLKSLLKGPLDGSKREQFVALQSEIEADERAAYDDAYKVKAWKHI